MSKIPIVLWISSFLALQITARFVSYRKMPCIFCHRDHQDETVEHIIPRSLGNLHYILPKGNVCGRCNNRFAKYEQRVLNSEIFYSERKRLGLLKPQNDIVPHKLDGTALHPFLLKMGYEAIYRSRKKLWAEYDFEVTRTMLVDGKISPLLDDQGLSNVIESKSIPRWLNTFRLGRNKMKLLFSRTEDGRLFVHFHFGVIKAKVRMV